MLGAFLGLSVLLLACGIRVLRWQEVSSALPIADYAADLWPTRQACQEIRRDGHQTTPQFLKRMETYMRVGKAFQTPFFNLTFGRFVIKWSNRLTSFYTSGIPDPKESKGTLAGLDYIKFEPTGPSHYQILFIHGGAYILSLEVMGPVYRNFARYLVHHLQATVWMPDYRVAPEYRFPIPFEDCMRFYRAWRKLLQHKEPQMPRVLSGDSAGGGLALAMVNALPKAEQPVAAIVYSPWTDLMLTGRSLKTKAEQDPMLNADVLPYVRNLYADSHFWKDPRASPLYGQFIHSAPILMIHGGKEILSDDTARLASKLQQKGRRVHVVVEPDLFHAFPVFAPFLPHTSHVFATEKLFVESIKNNNR